MILWSSLIASALVGGACKSHNNSADTDKAAKELRQAADEVNAKAKAANLQAAVVADQQVKLANVDDKLGSAQVNLVHARATYAIAVAERLAKLDDNLAKLGAKTDTKSKDAVTGLRARREQLAAKLAAMQSTQDPGWDAFTKDVDTTFDSIEKDLGNA